MTHQQETEILKKLAEYEHKYETIGADELKGKINIKNKVLNVLHLNIRSIRKNYDELIIFLETYNLLYCDIIILGECFQLDSHKQFNIQGYSPYYNHGDFNKNDGLIIFIKTEINTDITSTKLENSGVTVTKINLEINNISYGITTVYRSPNTNIQAFIQDVNEFLVQNHNQNIEMFIGDTNINILDNNSPMATHVNNNNKCLYSYKIFTIIT